MASILRTQRVRLIIFAAALMLISIPARAQQTQGASDERVAVAVNVDFLNAYMFRGVRQDDSGLITWPSAQLGVRLHGADSGLTSVRVSVGTWNSLNSGWAGSDGPSGKRWYESGVYTAVSLGFSNAATLNTAFTAYRSPNDMFTTVKELSVGAALDRPFGGLALRPYVLAAFELDTEPGIGQLDGGFKSGRYLELGATPGYPIRRISVAAPVKVGLSIGNYYELAGSDHRFGFASVAGVVTVPLIRSASAGSLNVHGGVEFQRLGETTKTFNGGDASKTIASVGIGFTH
jgi:hypothetical protein